MLRRHLLTSAAAMVAAPLVNLGRCRLFGAAGISYSTQVIDLVERSLVVDMLGLLTMDWAKLDRWHQTPSSFTAADYDELLRAGINVLNPAVELASGNPHTDTLQWMRRWQGFLAQRPDYFRAVKTASDLMEAKQTGRIGVVIGMQNSDHFRTAEDVFLFHTEGQRISQLTYNSANRIGAGCTVRPDEGLSSFGVEVIQAMNAAGMVIDVSHTSERTTMDAIEASAKPLLITHSNCGALVNHPRCKSDEAIRAMARKGGVMGITGVRTFLSNRNRPTVEDALDHFEHIARLVGAEHAGIGSDAGIDSTPPAPYLNVPGLHHPRRVFDITEGLVRRGYSESAITGILGGNFQRVLQGILPA